MAFRMGKTPEPDADKSPLVLTGPAQLVTSRQLGQRVVRMNHLGPDVRDALGREDSAAGVVADPGSIAAGAFVDVAVTFPSGRFSDDPVVVAMSSNSWVNVAVTGTLSSAGMTLRCRNVSTGNQGVGPVFWWAVESH